MAITRSSIQQQQEETVAKTNNNNGSVAKTNNNNNESVAENNSNSNSNNDEKQEERRKGSDYEETREQRIKENRERLQKLGIVDLTLQLSNIAAATKRNTSTPNRRTTPLKCLSFGPSNLTLRRSSRLQNAPPVTYTEQKEEKLKRPRDIVLEEGAKPEVYTEEHDKLLGDTEMPWTFGIDGYGADGARIYDPVKGKTCHQCRQKTLGQRTHCCKCNLVQGQFCGDCLFARYGEHVVEANQNPNWICPPCRGICNCSLCRQAKGWYPTGAIYRTISKLGYKSVAHYLIATKRAPPVSNTSSDDPQPAKRSLPFEGMEVPDDSKPDNKAMVEYAETNQQPEKNAIIVNESDPKSAKAGTRKRSNKDSDANEDSVKETDKSVLKEGSVGRLRKKPKTETNGMEDVPSPVNGPNTSTPTASKSNTTLVRRSTRRSRKESDENIEQSVELSAATGNEAVSPIKGPNISDPKEGSVARRLRSRNKT